MRATIGALTTEEDTMASKDKGGAKTSKKVATKDLKQKRAEKRAKKSAKG